MSYPIPYFSVVIPLYNKERYIARTLDSVLSQSFGDFEVLVVDDGSTDNGCEVVSNFTDERIRFIQQENRGVSAARNRGISEARAHLIAFIDADDTWKEFHLEKLAGLASKFPDAGLYASAFSVEKGKGVVRHVTPKFAKDFYGGYFDLLKKGGSVWSSAVAVRRSVFDKAGTFRVGCRIAEDLDAWFRIGLFFKVAYSPVSSALYYFDTPDSATSRYLVEAENPLWSSYNAYRADERIPDDVKSAAKQYVSNKIRKDIFRLAFENCEARSLAGMLVKKWQLEFSPGLLSRASLKAIFLIPRPLLIISLHVRLKCVPLVLRLCNSVSRGKAC